ncbi:sensor domain-containing diguanylate cyclase [Stakelama tenebrarum]|uniref:diguanylate cyclase n=1 Tax=Stakelama tenebrarum TaxID=2711215 RepID=A0A6G6Y3X4_9SPHN|nr:diguanylate cyclase [Sphingosinithalassobacter tenebrarum]QIG79313.1 diguanylate cyclase [Sphingosinithalassobacter tenebrarum]
MRRISSFLAALLIALFLTGISAARAEHPIGRDGCGVATDKSAGLTDALRERAAHSCAAPGSQPGARQWTVIDFETPVGFDAPVSLRTKFTDFSAVAVHVQYADGHWSSRQWDSGIAQRNWIAGGRMTLPLEAGPEGAPVRRIVMSVDDANSSDMLANLTIVPTAQVAAHDYDVALLFALLCGLVAVPILYDLAFLLVLRERFLFWHLAMASCSLFYIFISSGLVVVIFPGIPTSLRWSLHLWSFILAIASAMQFAAHYLTEGGLGRPMRVLIKGAALLALTTGLLLGILDLGAVANYDLLHDTSLGLVLLTCIVALAHGLMRGSRPARFLAAAWSLTLIFFADRWLRAFGFYSAPDWMSYAVYVGLAFETVVTALGVADRFLSIRRDRDHALALARTMEHLADTDPLTGIGNRRAVERRFRNAPRPTALALIDLDHFKHVNDRHGHDIGDLVLKSVARALSTIPRHLAGRMGGEEFALLLYGPDPLADAERLRQAITAHVARDVPGLDSPVTASMGLARLEGGEVFEAACKAADTLLYDAKKSGRNRLYSGHFDYAMRQKAAAEKRSSAAA